MKRVFFSAVTASMLISSHAGTVWPDVAELPSHPEPPDLLSMLDGRKISTPDAWFQQRRPELKALFQHYMYGTIPPAANMHGTVTYTDPHFFDGKATLKLVTLQLPEKAAPTINMLVVIPNHRTGPAPVFLGMNFNGNHTLVTDPHVPLASSWMASGPHVTNHHATESGRGADVHVWELEQSIERGYAVAAYYCGDVEPDTTNAVGGVRETIHQPGMSDDWGTIAAWAWGLQRAVDYLVTDNDIDRKHIALVGHSRMGKAAILAGAFDDRVALVVPLQSGCGGTAPSRGTVGESVQKINTAFPHWFCGEFKKFNTQPDRLPFDQDALIALCAPRSVLIGAAVEDTWANPVGTFDMLKSADKVYRLVGVEGLAARTMPETNKLVGSNLGFFIRPGIHSMTKLDWQYFLDFADKQWGKPRTE
jgi:hypothetical protein